MARLQLQELLSAFMVEVPVASSSSPNCLIVLLAPLWLGATIYGLTRDSYPVLS